LFIVVTEEESCKVSSFVRLSSSLSLSLTPPLVSRPVTYSLQGEVGLNDDQKSIWQMCSAFAEKEMLPHMAEWDEKEIFPVDTLRQLAELGFGAIYASDVRYGSVQHAAGCRLSFKNFKEKREKRTCGCASRPNGNDVAIVFARFRPTHFPFLVLLRSMAVAA
jgi:hypothetical protein